MSYTVVVDSCCDLTRAMRAQGHFLVVPLTIHVGEQSFVDDEQLRSSKLLAAMKECPEAPHTSCPSPADYLDAFESADGDIYVVTLSALLSGSHNAARQAAKLFLEEHPPAEHPCVQLLFCLCRGGAAALKLSELAQSGLSFPQVVAQADQAIAEMNTLFILENLDNLKKERAPDQGTSPAHRRAAHQAAHGLHPRGGDLQAGTGPFCAPGADQAGRDHGG